MTKQELFGDIDFKNLEFDDFFKEDSVRERIIMPILTALGYTEENIERSKTLEHPFLKIGSQKRPVKLIPDYAIKIGDYYAWVLDAKSPKQKADSEDNVAQVYSYAVHPEIRGKFFAICNGTHFVVYKPSDYNTPVLYMRLDAFEEEWERLYNTLGKHRFLDTKDTVTKNYLPPRTSNKDFDYKNRPLLKEIPVKKQAAKRHFGVHGYFTSQSWNVVQEYIKNYTQPGDLVLDPFGGKGVTAIEAMMTERKAINIDLNPMAIFMVESLIAPVNSSELTEAFETVKTEYLKYEPKTDIEIEKALKKYEKQLPNDLPLPKSSDVDSVLKLFSKKQLAQLALLKSIIKKQKNEKIRKSLLLAFSSTINKINLTYHDSTTRVGNAGNSSVFAYYRYRIAKENIFLDVFSNFEGKYKKLLSAKKDIEYYINENTIENIDVRKGTATDLNFIESETVDYIYTDPPYGNKIPYLDLSTMWNAWLDLDVSEEDYKLEAIEGGEQNKSKKEYNNLIAKSIREMYRVLKWDRWMSFVFAHKDPEFWDLIINTAECVGFEYCGCVSQKNGKSSFKKYQNPFTVLSGQLIINFRKTSNPKAIMKANLGMDTYEIIIQTIEGVIARNNGATLEQINDELIIRGLELGFLHQLKKEYSDLSPILLNNFDYNSDTELFTLKKSAKFKSHIDDNLRIRYYLISYLRNKERKGINPTFDDIVLDIMPLLKNGKTPDEQTILGVLESIAERVGKDGWKLSNGELF